MSNNKVNKFIMPNGDEIKIDSGSGLEICDIGMALYIDETKGLRRYLNGQIVDINTNTQAFLNRLLQIKTTNPEYFTTEDNWQAEALLNIDGCVYKFVLNYADDGETVVSVRLPKYPDYVEVDAGNVPVKGNGMSLGFTTGSKNFGLLETANQAVNNVFANRSAFNVPVGKFTPTSWDGETDQALGITTDPTKSGIVGTLTQTKFKLRYFIQIATGSETENNIINDIELNNPYSLFDYKYSPFELNNISWLKSNGQWNAKAVYPDAYDKLLKVYNGTETVDGLSVKLSTESYTDYDFVLNTAEETFRLPLDTIDHPINSTSTLPVKGNGMTLGLTDGTSLFGQRSSGYNYTSLYGVNVGNTSATGMVQNTGVGVTTDSSKSGIVADLTSTKANLYLYFYVGETVQNANLIDAGRIGEQLANKTDKVQAAQASMPSSKYIDLTLNANGSTYTSPANGWFATEARINAGGFIALWCKATGSVSKCTSSVNGMIINAMCPVKKGDIVALQYTNYASDGKLKFIYADGVKEEV